MISTDNICKGSLLRNITFESDDNILCVLSDRAQDIRCLFSLLCKAKEPDSGSLRLPDGIIPFLPGPYAFPKNLTVSDCLKFAGASANISDFPAITKELTSDISKLRFSSLSPLAALKACTAVLLVSSPEYILLEDPVRALSPSDYGKFTELLKKISVNTKVIFSCSIPSVFEEVSDSLLVLSEGRLLEYGSTEAVLKKANSPGTLICRIKGDAEKISEIAKSFGADSSAVEKTERKGVFKLTIPETDNHKRVREIKRAVSKAGMALLDIHSDNGALKKLLQAMNDRENELDSDYAEEGDYIPVDENILSFNHDLALEEDDDDGDISDGNDDTDNDDVMQNDESSTAQSAHSSSDTAETGEVKLDLSSLLSHQEDNEDEPVNDGESTLFSSGSLNKNKKNK